MPPRTSQLQIRVSPAEKAALKRLAGLSGQTVSAYVLAQALPASTDSLSAAFKDLRAKSHELAPDLSALRRSLSALAPLEFGERLQSVSVADLPHLTQNRVAALAEDVAHHLGVPPPSWTAAIPPLDHPFFRWQLLSLRPYQLRATAVSLKRRNIFDPSMPDEEPRPRAPSTDGPWSRLQVLAPSLHKLELAVEFYFLGGAVLHQAFAARPATVRPKAMFKPCALVAQATREVARSQGWPDTWLEESLRDVLRPGPQAVRWVDLECLKAFTPPPEYALAIKVAAATAEPTPPEVDDLRFLLRLLNVTSVAGALFLVTRYFAARQLPPYAQALLTRLVGA